MCGKELPTPPVVNKLSNRSPEEQKRIVDEGKKLIKEGQRLREEKKIEYLDPSLQLNMYGRFSTAIANKLDEVIQVINSIQK